jgi:hypothetical protein
MTCQVTNIYEGRKLFLEIEKEGQGISRFYEG